MFNNMLTQNKGLVVKMKNKDKIHDFGTLGKWSHNTLKEQTTIEKFMTWNGEPGFTIENKFIDKEMADIAANNSEQFEKCRDTKAKKLTVMDLYNELEDLRHSNKLWKASIADYEKFKAVAMDIYKGQERKE